MPLIPHFEFGLWNAWILQVCFFLTMFIQDFLMGKEAKKRTKRMSQQVPFEGVEKILALSTHIVIMPFVFIYSFFVPLKIGSLWLYIGLMIVAVALMIQIVSMFNVAKTSVDMPVTQGIYKVMRHPIYFSGFLLYLGIGIAAASWVILICAMLWIVLFNVASPAEERFLLGKYGDSYREYMNKTPRWIGFPKSGAS